MKPLRPIALVLLSAPSVCGAGPPAPVLSVNLVVTPAVASVGSTLTVMLSVANMGSVTVTDVSSALALGGPATAALVAVPETSVRPALGPGEEVVTGWGVVGTAPGALSFTATVSGVWIAGGRTVTGWAAASASAVVRAPPKLEAAWSGPSAGWCAPRPFPVTLAVTNAGESDAAGVAAPAPVLGGTAGASVVAGPAGGTSTIAAGGTVAYTWTVVGTIGGTLVLGTTVTGADAGSGMPVLGTASAEWTLAAPGRLAVSVAVPPEVSRGQWVPIVVTVTNTGGYAVSDLEASLEGPAGAGWVRTVPVPSASHGLAPGAARRFVWTWSATALGSLPFGVRTSCATCDGFLAVEADASATSVAVRPAALQAGLSVSATQMVVGQKVTIVLAVTNTGGAAVRRLTALVPTPSTGRSALASGPLRATIETLPAGGSTAFAWVWTVTGHGLVGFTSRATGHDANARWGLSTGILDSPSVRVLTPASLKIDRFALFPSPAVVSGIFLTASLVITNQGETPAQLTGLTVKEKKSPTGVLGPASLFSPRVPSDLPAGDSTSVVWTYHTGVWGTATVSAVATAVEPATGRKLPSLQALSNRITVTAWMAPGGLE
ncbi:MAG: hypothetical protein AAB152_12945 [Candidatus Coatesbacteria bacterium]